MHWFIHVVPGRGILVLINRGTSDDNPYATAIAIVVCVYVYVWMLIVYHFLCRGRRLEHCRR